MRASPRISEREREGGSSSSIQAIDGLGVVKLGCKEEGGGGRAHLMYLDSLPLAEARYILTRL